MIALFTLLLAFHTQTVQLTVPQTQTSYITHYYGVGKGVYQNGTIVQVINGKPVIVGNNHTPGVWELHLSNLQVTQPSKTLQGSDTVFQGNSEDSDNLQHPLGNVLQG